MRPLRSWLFVPGDSERKLQKGEGAGADALILDLEDAVMPANKPQARRLVADYLAAHPPENRSSRLWVRINPLDSREAMRDLAEVARGKPDGIVLPKINDERDLIRLSHYLEVLETQTGVVPESIGILPVATETAAAPFALGGYRNAQSKRLVGLTWGAEDLATALSASTNQDPSGGWALTFRLVRSWTLLGAHASGVQAIETLYVDIEDDGGLEASCRAARAEGFSGRIAIHPRQVPIINAAFTPSEDEITFARRVVSAFEGAKGAGAVRLDGRMLDIPHLKQAENIIAQIMRL